MDIEREVELGGPLHSKGVLILSSYLSATYASDVPLSLWASIVFEQSYGGVDGDIGDVHTLRPHQARSRLPQDAGQPRQSVLAGIAAERQRQAVDVDLLDLDDAARKWLADEGYDPVFGARPLKRVIQNALQNPLAEMLLAGDLKDGETVVVGAGTEGLIIGDRVGTSNRNTPQDATVH